MADVEPVDAVVAVALPSGQSEQAPVPELDLCVHICLHRLGCYANWRLLAMTKEYIKQWIPACAGMTVFKFCK
ncbi:MAG: hypothetical protein IJX43_01645 [Alphaproteobacteria bacterium]|nr:hypothetical protein [Alphaproteobacteria bacterium]